MCCDLFKLVDYLWESHWVRWQVIWPKESENVSIRRQIILTLWISKDILFKILMSGILPNNVGFECRARDREGDGDVGHG